MFSRSRFAHPMRWTTLLIFGLALSLGLLLMQLSGSIAASPAGLGGDPAYPDPNWRAGTLGDVAVLDMAASPDYDRDNTLFAMTADTLYRTQDRGNSWQADGGHWGAGTVWPPGPFPSVRHGSHPLFYLFFHDRQSHDPAAFGGRRCDPADGQHPDR